MHILPLIVLQYIRLFCILLEKKKVFTRETDAKSMLKLRKDLMCWFFTDFISFQMAKHMLRSILAMWVRCRFMDTASDGSNPRCIGILCL